MFFFQAEDGMRDLVRSRGLGDVYKRQPLGCNHVDAGFRCVRGAPVGQVGHRHGVGLRLGAVSYTHLTLPTSDLV